MQYVLARREREVAALAGQGRSNKEIAQALTLTHGTVKIYLTRIYQKTGLNRVELVRVGMEDLRRARLVRLREWVTQWSGSLQPEALEQLKGILYDEAAAVFREGSD